MRPQEKDMSKLFIHQRKDGSLLINIATSLEAGKYKKQPDGDVDPDINTDCCK